MTTDDGNPRRTGVVAQVIGIADDGATLLRQELELARQETVEKLTPAALSAGMVLGGGVVAATGLTYLLQAGVQLLATRMPLWLASLLAGAGFTAGGITLIRRGAGQLQTIDLVPRKTINSLKEDQAWLIDQIKSRLI